MQINFDHRSSVTPTAGSEIVFRRMGQGEKMLVMHGGSGSYRHWIRNLPLLAEHFACVALDLPGFGDSGDVAPDISLEQYIDLVTEGVNLIWPEGEPFHVVGFSFGGMIGAGLAAHMNGRVRRLTLLGPGGMGKPKGEGPSVELLKARPGMEEEDILRVHRTNLENMMIRDASRISDETVSLHRANIELARFRNWGLSWTDSVVGFLAQMDIPAQFLIGEKDPMARPSVAHRLERVRAAKPDIHTHILAGVGHWAQYEAPELVNGLLLRFHSPSELPARAGQEGDQELLA
ncbi:MAG: alpha/beta hydrolase [SAR324 cluster bacterium]|nr:alpha/beta hydrolase [SAR324 cluster bacterium]